MVPALGLLLNVAMLVSILYLYITGNADSKHEAAICFALAGGWAVISILYVVINSARKQRPVLGIPVRTIRDSFTPRDARVNI